MPDVVDAFAGLVTRRPIATLSVAAAVLVYVAMMRTGPRER